MNAHIRPGDSVAVIGPGPIGLLCAVMAKLCGANPLIVIGVKADAKRLAVARTIGATHTFGEQGEDVAAAIKTTRRRLWRGRGRSTPRA